MTTTDTPRRLLRHAPADWKPGLTRVRYTADHDDVSSDLGTFAGNSQPLPGVTPHGWLGVLVKFDGGDEAIDVDPADLVVTHLRDPFAAVAGRLPTRYAPGDTARPYPYAAEGDDVWHPVIYYPAGEVVDGEGPIWLVEPYPAARADGTDGQDPIEDDGGAGVAVLRGSAAPTPRTADPEGDWVVAGRTLTGESAYDAWVGDRRDLLAAWGEAWAIAAALNTGAVKALGVKPEDVEVLLAAERRDLVGDSRYAGTFKEMRWTQIGTDPDRPDRMVPARQAARLRDSPCGLIETCVVADRETGGVPWQQTTYTLSRSGVKALAAIRQAGFELGGPRCRTCGCTEDQACPGGCSWRRDRTGGPLCTACPTEGTTR